jgi:2'-5' RNA ligase
LERTIGVAIGIPQPWGAELDAFRVSTGDPAGPLIPSHVTLLGPTVLTGPAGLDDELDTLLIAAARAQEPFTIHLRGTGTFRPLNQVVFVALAGGASECEKLAGAVRSGPLQRELVYPYHPHVTVAHDVPEPAMDEIFDRLARYEARFDIDHFTRYEHGGDGRWRPVRSYALGEPG